jgi:hypothetical protein
MLSLIGPDLVELKPFNSLWIIMSFIKKKERACAYIKISECVILFIELCHFHFAVLDENKAILYIFFY